MKTTNPVLQFSKRGFGLALCASIALSGAMAQMPQRTPTPNDTLKSPNVMADKRVAIQIYAPKATEVTVGGDFLSTNKPVSLVKNEQGVWSAVLGPLRPDYYTYTLMVDGVRTMDPKNPIVKQGISSLENVMAVPGPETAFEDNRAVPHGEVREVWYSSSSLNMMRRMHVYTPPGYEKGNGKYPVFYLLHGAGDDDSGWNTVGRAGFILDNLIAAGQAKPMIVVMPNGSMPMRPATGQTNPMQGLSTMRDMFASEFLKDVMPYVEKTYRILPNRENRALAGLSMGGFQTFQTTMTNLDKFAYIGGFSGAGRLQPGADVKQLYDGALTDADAFNKKMKLVYVSIGTKEPERMYAGVKGFHEALDKAGVKHVYYESPGTLHEWQTWRRSLRQYASLIFKK
ncbi:MAG: esterase [Cytophagaceae bacterium]|nr:MAG: esterase [Cytophagaceae bacterium]